MKKIKKIISAVLAAAVVIITCTACNSDKAVNRVKHNGVITIGYSADAPFVIENKGLTVEPAVKTANTMSVEADFIRLTADEAYDRLIDGTVDCLWNVVPPKKEDVASVRTIDTGIYYRQVIMTTADSNITRFADVSGKKLAVVSGSDAQAELHEASVMESSLGEIKVYSTMEEVLTALTSGETDCAAVDEPQALYYTLDTSDNFKFIDTPISEESLVIATRAEDADLCSKIAEKYVKMAQEGEIKLLCKEYTSDETLLSSVMSSASSET